MYIEKIKIKNYKAISDMEMELSKGVNLLIGGNGVGKTSILEAFSTILSGMFKKISGVPTKNILQNDIHFCLEETGDASTVIRYKVPAEIECWIEAENHNYVMKKARANEDGQCRTKSDDDGISQWMQKKVNEEESLMPLLCFQSDARVWQTMRSDFGRELKKRLNDRRCGYIGCFAYSLDIKGIQSWCLKMELNAFQKKKEIREYEVFKHIVASFMQKISDLKSRPEIYYSSQLEQLVYKEGDLMMPITTLSAGYQSLLWMVMNLAYRVALLNPHCSFELSELEGIVLIDEIDMHLHPQWQWKIVSALEETFPNVQFILATHSPIVISSCKNEKMILITDKQEVCYLPNAYGFSVQDVLMYRQGTSERPSEVKGWLETFEQAMEEERFDKAKDVLETMERMLGTEHAVVRGAKTEWELYRLVEE